LEMVDQHGQLPAVGQLDAVVGAVPAEHEVLA
jgi:hypothetical protein